MKLFFSSLLVLTTLTTTAQLQDLVNAKRVVSKDSFNLDGIWRKNFPSTDQVTGGIVTWLTGYTFAVSAAEYQIKSRAYKSNAGTISLNAPHSTFNRLDVIALNTAGQIVKITGTASATPAIPQIDPATQVYLTTILVTAGSTSPGGVSSLTIYNENTEWSISHTFPTINMASTAAPQNGTVSMDITGTNASNDVSASGDMKISDAGTHNYSDFTVLRFYIRLKQAWTAGASLQVGLGMGGEPMTQITAANGFNPSVVGSYQNISVPMSQFPKTGNVFGAFYLIVTGNGKGFYIDNIQLQGGVGGGGGNGYVTNVYRNPGSTTVYQVINGVSIPAYIDSLGTGGGGGGITTLLPVGVSSNSNGALISGGALQLQPANTNYPGVITTGGQQIAGNKTFIGITNFANQVDINNGQTSIAAINGLKVRFDGAGYTGITIDNADASGRPSLYFRNDGINSNLTGVLKMGSASTGYAGPNSFNIINLAANPIGFATSNITRLQIDGNGDFKYTTPHSVATADHIPSRGQVDSLMSKKLTDSAFDVVRPITPGDVKLFEKISTTKLQISDLKNSASITWTKNPDSTISGTVVGGGGGTFSGSIGASQVAFGTASNTLGGNNNLYTNGSALSIGTTDLSTQLQVRGADGGSLLKIHSTDAFADILLSASTSPIEGGNRVRGHDGITLIANYIDILKGKNNGNLKIYGGVEYAGKQTITAGTTSTVSDNVYNVYVDPASLLASHTVTMPASPSDGQEINIIFGGTIAAGATVVTSLTIAANTGHSLYQAITPTTAKGGDMISYKFNATNSKWYRIIN